MRGLIEIAVVALGGAIGASLRYGVGRVLHASLREHTLALPSATLLVNVVGCFAIGAILPWMLAREGDGAAAHARLLLVVGLLGGLTTYSAFGFEAISIWREGRSAIAIGYVALHMVLGFAAVGLGVLIGERVIA